MKAKVNPVRKLKTFQREGSGGVFPRKRPQVLGNSSPLQITRVSNGVKVIGVGNILLKDEGVGVKVIDYIKEKSLLPQDIEIIDGGTGGMRLIPLINDADYLIIIDAVKGGGGPGDIYKFTIDDLPLKIKQKTSLHEVGLQEIFSLLDLMKGKRPKTIIFGVEPKEIAYGVGLTPEVESVVPEIALRVSNEVERILNHRERSTIYA